LTILKTILEYLEVSDCNMEEGSLRCDANVSIRPKGRPAFGTKTEIKNLNSFRAVARALEYEIKRHIDEVESGEKIIQETRLWNEGKGVTLSMRSKEEAHDYRYFPEPDLPPLSFSAKDIKKIKAGIPELPQQRRERFKKEFKLDDKEIEVFIQHKDLGEYFEQVVSEAGDPKLVKLISNYLITDLQGLLKGMTVTHRDFKITPENFAEFITLISQGKISSKIAKVVLQEMFSKGADPSNIIEEKGLTQITDTVEIGRAVRRVVDKNPKAVEDYKKGKENALQFLIGQVMAQTKGKANPETVNQILRKLLRT